MCKEQTISFRERFKKSTGSYIFNKYLNLNISQSTSCKQIFWGKRRNYSYMKKPEKAIRVHCIIPAATQTLNPCVKNAY